MLLARIFPHSPNHPHIHGAENVSNGASKAGVSEHKKQIGSVQP